MHNPSLREESRFKVADVIPLQHETSILDWLEANNRLIAREERDPGYEQEEEEIAELMSVDDSSYDDDDEEDLIEED